MTREEAIDYLQVMKDDYPSYESVNEALDMAIKAAENIGHLTDRPCSVCEFNKENGCCKWSCVFER